MSKIKVGDSRNKGTLALKLQQKIRGLRYLKILGYDSIPNIDKEIDKTQTILNKLRRKNYDY